jgi:hypothetical protein
MSSRLYQEAGRQFFFRFSFFENPTNLSFYHVPLDTRRRFLRIHYPCLFLRLLHKRRSGSSASPSSSVQGNPNSASRSRIYQVISWWFSTQASHRKVGCFFVASPLIIFIHSTNNLLRFMRLRGLLLEESPTTQILEQ